MIGELLKPSEVSEQSDTNMLYKPQIQSQRKRKLPKHERSPCLYTVIQGTTYPIELCQGLPLWISWSKNLPAIMRDLGSVPGLGRSPGEGKGYPLQYVCEEHRS